MSSDRKPAPRSQARSEADSPEATSPQPSSRSRSQARSKGASQQDSRSSSGAKPKRGSGAKSDGGSGAKPGSSAEGKPKGGSEAKPRSRSRSEPKSESKQQPGREREPGPKDGRRRKAPAREISAGGVVVRGEEMLVIVPTRRASDGSRVLGLPKGHVDPGETAIQAAEREVREETGIIAEAVRELGEARYWYRRNGRTIGKSVSFYLFTHLGGDTADHDDEVEEVRWIGLKEAQTALTHEAEREMVGLALACLEEGAPKDR
jgi:8-oxo-dGTP pyrophosphatase MutT (NUDIX family)